jgi:hypothetical protein
MFEFALHEDVFDDGWLVKLGLYFLWLAGNPLSFFLFERGH